MALFLGPVAFGLVGTMLPALAIQPWLSLLDQPGLACSVLISLASGMGGTALALGAAILIAAAAGERIVIGARGLLLPALLAIPHLASAVGTSFLLAPSGWIVRAISPWLTGWQRPPDLAAINDPWGLALTMGLALREAPFLLLALAAARPQVATARILAVGRTCGYGPIEAWLKLVLPLLYRQIRLPLYAVLAFALSVVDMAIVLGPSAPPALAVQALRWLTDPDAVWHPVGAAAAILQLALIVAALVLWRIGEWLVARMAQSWLVAGPSRSTERCLSPLAHIANGIVFGIGLAGLVATALWSVASIWRFPAALPQAFSLASWRWAVSGLATATWTTLAVGVLTSLVAVVVVLACLEHEARAGKRPDARVLALVYLPLLLPQIAFLQSCQVMLVWLDLDGTLRGLAWMHLVFVLPYTVLMLRGPYLAFAPHWLAAGRSLGRAPAALFVRVRLPLMRRPILVALAVGFSVSVAQYLPTLFAAAGRHPTLITETLALSQGGDRRLAAAAALLLAALPLLALGGALAVPSPRLGHREPD